MSTNPVQLTDTDGGHVLVTGANALSVDGSGAVQPVSGTVVANAGTGTFSVTNAGTFTVSQTTGTNLHTVVDSVTGTLSVTPSGTFHITVDNFPATQPVSGTVSISGTVPVSNPLLTQQTGTWAYYAGASGTVNVVGRVIGIAAHGTAAASFTIAGGASITIPAGSSVQIQPLGNVTSPQIIFTSTDSYFIEVVT